MNPNDDRDKPQDKKAIEEGNKASKRNEAKRRLIAMQGEAILENDNLEDMITQEVKRMDELAAIPKPTVENHNVHESVAESDSNKVHGDQIPGQTTRAQNTQNQDVEAQNETNLPESHADKKPDTGDQVKRQANAVRKS